MKRITNLLLLLVLSATALVAQEMSGNVLTSWSNANGAIRIPDGVTEIAANCFYSPGEEIPGEWGSSDPVSNTNITSVDLNGVTKIGENAFRGCTGIKTIKAPKLESVGSHSFEGCTALEALDLLMIKTIGEKAFENANALTSLSLGKSLEAIVGNPFQNSTSLTSLTLEKVPYMPSCTSFGKGAFGLASALKEVHIPDGCSIAANTFTGCQIIKSVYSYSVEPPVINEATFKDIYAPEEATLYVKEGAKEAYSKAKGWNIFGHIVEEANLAVATVEELAIQLYPNPTQELLHVVGAGADSDILLYDLTGALVGTARTDATGSAVVSLASYPAGTYVVRVSGADRLVVKQ